MGGLPTACGVLQSVITCTGTSPGTTAGTCTLICVGYTAKIGAATAPNCTQTPARLVGSCPSTSAACAAVPAGAKFVPKMVTIAFGDSAFTGGLLRPALMIPPAAMDGEFDASAVSEN